MVSFAMSKSVIFLSFERFSRRISLALSYAEPTRAITSSSIFAAVCAEHRREVSPPRYGLSTVSRAISPNVLLIPYRVTIALAIFVARSMSFEAPVVIVLNTSSSAARPATNVTILANAASRVNKNLSSSSVCIVNPSAPEVRGMIVIF